MILNDNVQVLLNKLRFFSPEMYEHSLNVAKIAESFAKYLNLTDQDIKKLRTAALLHDIGKLLVPDYILNKPTKLTNEEYEIIKKHPIYSVKLLINANFNDAEVLYLILHHHERLDGLGYPQGLKGENISMLLRILSICDCFDAMRSKRAYKKAQNIEFIKSEYLNNIKTQFDQTYVNCFLNYLDSQLVSQSRMIK